MEECPVFLWKQPICLSESFSLRGSHFTQHISRGQLKYSPKTEAAFFALSLHLPPGSQCLLERSLYACLVHRFLEWPPRGHPFISWFCLTSRTCVHGSQRTVTNRKGVLNQLYPGHSGEAAVKEKKSFGERGLLVYLHSRGLRSRLLIKYTPSGWLQSSLDVTGHHLHSQLVPYPWSPMSSRKELVYPSSPLAFAATTQRTLSLIAWFSQVQRDDIKQRNGS